jgi:hypothetical protein
MLLLDTSNPRDSETEKIRSGEPMNSKPVFDALCTGGMPKGNESCGRAPKLEAEFYV